MRALVNLHIGAKQRAVARLPRLPAGRLARHGFGDKAA